MVFFFGHLILVLAQTAWLKPKLMWARVRSTWSSVVYAYWSLSHLSHSKTHKDLKKKERIYVHICITDSLCSTAETNKHCKSTILQKNKKNPNNPPRWKITWLMKALKPDAPCPDCVRSMDLFFPKISVQDFQPMWPRCWGIRLLMNSTLIPFTQVRN